MQHLHVPTLPAVIMAGMLALLTGPAQADVTLNAGARLSHDNNVNGSPDSPSKANQRSDNYLSLNASAVYFTPLKADKSRYFIGQIGVASSAYNQFDNLDSSMLSVSAGLYQQLAPTWSGQITARAYNRNTEQSERDADGLGATLEIKKQLTQTVWIKGVADYEDNKANLSTFSYTGKTYGVNLGYLPLKDSFITLGYSHNKRDFNGTTAFASTAKTLFVELTQRIAKNWYLNAGYAHGDNDSNFSGTAYTNQTVSMGVSYSY